MQLPIWDNQKSSTPSFSFVFYGDQGVSVMWALYIICNVKGPLGKVFVKAAVIVIITLISFLDFTLNYFYIV